MPKTKTHKGAAKRLKVTGSGKLRRRQSYRSHLAVKKSSRRLRRLQGQVPLSKADERRARRLLAD
ncbi:MAG: 50S ribosomal protein L35 [Actinomycetota bacterium]|nr:50S ribosomal protein L35 [Actinomycetota bacterium]